MAARRKPKKPAAKAPDAARAARHLLSLDATRVMKRLTSKHDEAVGLFSRLRTREALVELCRSDFVSAPFSELAKLEPQEQVAVAAFHDVLFELRWYVMWTEDMPGTVAGTVANYVRRLETLHRTLTAVLGPPDALGHRVIEADSPAIVGARRSRR